jgi:hypothetical protein
MTALTETNANDERKGETAMEASATNGGRYYGIAALLLVLEFLLLTAALVVLGVAINWPASLDEPANVNLPLITEQRGAVLLGYGAYMLYSVLVLPLGMLLYRLLAEREGSASPLLTVAVGFAAVSALARSLGILRWFILMPVLAEMYLDPGASEATRETVSLIYDAFNAYAGGVGEVLGVGLFGGLFFGLVSVALVRSRRFPAWIGYAGVIVAALLLAGVLEAFGLDLGPVLTVSVTALQLWMLALAIVLLRARRSSRRAA